MTGLIVFDMGWSDAYCLQCESMLTIEVVLPSAGNNLKNVNLDYNAGFSTL